MREWFRLGRIKIGAVALGLAATTLALGPAALATTFPGTGYPGPFLDVFNELQPAYVQLEGSNFAPGDSAWIYVWHDGDPNLFIFENKSADGTGHVFKDFNVPSNYCHKQLKAVMYDSNQDLATDMWTLTPHC